MNITAKLERNKMSLSRVLVILICVITVVSQNNVYANTTIIVNKGSFATVQDAAESEDSVDWLDNENTDDTACTESFAAVELATFLPKCIDPVLLQYVTRSLMKYYKCLLFYILSHRLN